MKTQDHCWTDPPADELVQRHRLSSPLLIGPSTPPVGRKPLGMTYKRSPGGDGLTGRSSNSCDDPHSPRNFAHWSPRDYVEALHQNGKSTLLYGKNNVVVQPNENLEPMQGYLSLHSTPAGLHMKWTPNELMNGCSTASCDVPIENGQNKNVFWDYALSVDLENIVYLHCHQQDGEGTIVLVGQDGVQRSPIRFPRGGHLLAFLTCLENGLLPYGQLDPPLWSQKGKGKVFPRLRRKGRSLLCNNKEKALASLDAKAPEEEASDYVFRIISTFDKPEISQVMLDTKAKTSTSGWSYLWKGGSQNRSRQQSSTSSTSSSASKSTFDESEMPPLVDPEASRDKSIQILCDTMKKQIISRAFYGWLAHCRHLSTVRTHLAGLVNLTIVEQPDSSETTAGLTKDVWERLHDASGAIPVSKVDEVHRQIYYGGIEHSIRAAVWPYLLGHYTFGQTAAERATLDKDTLHHYEVTMTEWLAIEAIVRQRDKEIMAANLAKLSSESNTSSDLPLIGPKDAANESNEVFTDSEDDSDVDASTKDGDKNGANGPVNAEVSDVKKKSSASPRNSPKAKPRLKKTGIVRQRQLESQGSQGSQAAIIVTNPSFDIRHGPVEEVNENAVGKSGQLVAESNSTCVSPASSNGGVYSTELLDLFSLNVHRIDKDVPRCDRNFWYFANKDNLEKLRNVMCTYVWEHLDQGYVQGMCDLVAPLLVIFDDEIVAYSCFCELMNRMMANFPNGGAMDVHFANMRSLIQILDNEIFELILANGDYTHFYFCYRWFLLDFKREFVYDDVFRVWEAIWSAKHVASANFVLFIALALVEYYRNIILENNMDFTDIIKFFNEMAERHDSKAVLKISRDLVLQIQTLIDNK